MATTTPGTAIETRYKFLGLTQESLAWLAGVSNSTVRNLTSGRVNTARTWPQIERALGWKPGSWEFLELGTEPPSFLPADALRAVVSGLTRLEGDAVEVARQSYIDFVNEINDVSHARLDPVRAGAAFGKLWESLSSQLSPAEIAPLLAVGREYLPPDADDSNRTPAAGGDGTIGVDRTIPPRLLSLLRQGEIRDWHSLAAPDDSLDIVAVAVARQGAEPTNRDRQFLLEQLQSMDNALRSAKESGPENPPRPEEDE